ncbi:hypothetical protein PAXINDRAFT_158500 [Paxillus involutus ATCC 200175]|uniref:Uncharacterized protein n=1 Tax=Paxillus involutus ATCC 200175 TaxID=664439 RepID=A0A0C9TGV4_PAXIN|nr:hypothetical protein PAXINDRAFT_158500 [Paxillus involutus ATCC 200175]
MKKMFLKATSSRSHAVIFAADPTPTPPSSGAIQLRTVIGIVLGLTGFVLLLFSFSFIYRRCFPSESTSRGSQQRTHPRHASRRRPRAPHFDYPVAAVSRSEPANGLGAPPPYEGLRLPPYTEQSLPHTGQSSPLTEQNPELNSPPMARLEV